MNLPKLSKRLRCAANFVRQGAYIADVGTDHAYLPIVLLAEGRICGGVASDINEGPIERARVNIREQGMSELLNAKQCDGLSDLRDDHPEDILILGMGGELIARILSDAPWTKTPSIRLILQPMTHPEVLRTFLLREGYSIVDEVLVKDEKIYQIICAEYTGIPPRKPYNELELLLGREPLRRGGELTDELLLHWRGVLSVRLAGKKSAGADTSEEETLLTQIGEYQNDHS
ncbi:MAG: SAM-dependent methyltransferase [Clostridia bacterium]|nr:SAM-dependent methyltransferase [Clostridia bacterium]